AVDGTTITKTGGVLKAVIPAVEKVDLTVNKTGDNAGKVEAPKDTDKGKLVTAENITKAINESYWVAKRGDSVTTNEDSGDGDSNVAAGNNVTFVAGKNMALQKSGNKFIYATKDDVTFTNVTTTNTTTTNLTVKSGGNVDMGGNQIHNVKAGTDDNDAVNLKQLKEFKNEVGGYGWNLSVNHGKDASKITRDTTVDLNNDDGNIKIAKNGSNVTLSLGPDVSLGKSGKDGKDGSLAVRGKDGASVEISGKDGSIGLTGPKGKDGTPGASATITVEKGTTTVNDDRDGGKEVTRIVYTDKDKNGNDIKREVATLDDGLKFKGDSKEVINRKLGSQVNITGGADSTKLTENNIGVVYDKETNGLKVKLSKDVKLGNDGTITIGDTVVNNDGLTITGGPSVTKGGVNAGNQSVTNVKDGTADNDAVNVKQLKAAKTEVEAGENIEITSRTDATNGQTIYKVSAKGINDTSAAVEAGSNHVKVTKADKTRKDGSTSVTDYTVDLSDKTKEDIKKGVDAHTKVTTEGLTFNADTGTTGVKKLGSKVAVNGDGKNITTTADENGVKVSMKDDIKVNSVTAKEVKVGDVNINENGINAGGKRITNVAPGKDGTDAVNVNQLKYVAGNISNQINNVDKGLRAGIAGALASGGLYHVTTAGKSMVSVGAGTYRGQNALAVGYSRLSDNGKVGVKFTVNSNSQGHAGASASVGYQW
ncbi:autotransporter adhesin, partial [Haemophilus haemolyticus]